MYCARCGVRLAESERACPLCHLPAYHPELPPQGTKRPYPAKEAPTKRARQTASAIVLTALMVAVLIFTFVCNLQLSQSVSWWKYVALSFALLYFVWVLPMWLPKIPSPFLLGADFVAVGGFLSLLNLFVDGDWFLPFAFPALGWTAAVAFSAWALCHYLPRRRLLVLGSEMVAAGPFMLLLEFLLDYTFGLSHGFQWSLYVLTAWCLFGGIVLLIALCRPLRRALSKKLFF